MIKFIYEEIFCRHDCIEKMMFDDGSENQKWVNVLIEKYKIRKMIVSAYHFEVNGMIEKKHTVVMDAFFKLTEKGYFNWMRCLPSILWADRITIRMSTEMISIRMIIDSEVVFSIELNISTWQMLPWNEIRSTIDLLTLRVRQIERRDGDLEEVKLHLQRIKIENKKLYDDKHRIRTTKIKKRDLILLHDIRFDNQHFEKLAFRWFESFKVHTTISRKGIFILSKFNGARFSGTVLGNKLKVFRVKKQRQSTSVFFDTNIRISESEMPNDRVQVIISNQQQSNDRESNTYLS